MIIFSHILLVIPMLQSDLVIISCSTCCLVETSTDPCDLNRSDKAASIAADDDQIIE